jgi:hypothetical protein
MSMNRKFEVTLWQMLLGAIAVGAFVKWPKQSLNVALTIAQHPEELLKAIAAAKPSQPEKAS